MEIADSACKIARALQIENYNLLHNAGALAGQTVFHAHFHLIPKWSDDEGLRFQWETKARFDQQDDYHKIKQALARLASH